MRRNAAREIKKFLDDDIGGGDITGALVPRRRLAARITSHEPAVVAGIAYARRAFALRGCRATSPLADGSEVASGAQIMDIRGDARAILSAERTALNVLSRMSGIATRARHLSGLIRGTRARLYATRKTAPGLGFLDKEAVIAGGGMRHRMTLGDMILIKDNHIMAAAASGLTVEDLVRRALKKHARVEVEAETVAEAVAAARAGATIVMLDNFGPARVRRAVAALRRAGLRGSVLLEASGGISARNIRAYADAGADMISVGSMTASVRSIDMSLDVMAP